MLDAYLLPGTASGVPPCAVAHKYGQLANKFGCLNLATQPLNVTFAA